MLAPVVGAEVAAALVLSTTPVQERMTTVQTQLNLLDLQQTSVGFPESEFIGTSHHRQLLLELAARLLKTSRLHSNAPSRLWDPSWNTRALWRSGERSKGQTRLLAEIFDRVQQTPHAAVVLDLDDTLYCSFFRKAAILREYGYLLNLEAMQQVQPEEANSWDLQNVLADNLHIDAETIATHIPTLVPFWNDRLFSSAYVLLDQPLPGASEFVQKLFALGAHIFYVTGRDEVNMRDGTLATLRRDGFPMDRQRSTLICKPQPILAGLPPNATQAEHNAHIRKSDVAYKERLFEIPRQAGRVVLYLDNEQGQTRRWQTKYPEEAGVAVWMDTAQSPFPEPLPPETPILHGFLS